jgi:hypothetical protein
VPYFMLFKIAFSGYEEGVGTLISCGPDNGCMCQLEREVPQVRFQLTGPYECLQVGQRDALCLHLDHRLLEAQ